MTTRTAISATYKTKLLGREFESQLLQDCDRSPKPSFIAVYGRRRIGKTFLIRSVFENAKNYMEVIGRKKGTNQTQINQFLSAFEQVAGIPSKLERTQSWEKTLETFTVWLEKSGRKFTLFLDELPWLCGKRSGLLEQIDAYWNSRWSKIANFTLVICGSASSWMLEKILNDTGGLYNRVTHKIHLHPLTLLETESYLNYGKHRFTKQQIIELYLIFGGVPFYLDLLPKGMSPVEIVNNLVVNHLGQLHEEYELLLEALFRDSAIHESIISILAKSRYGLSREEIVSRLRIEDGGSVTRALRELENCDFIREYLPFGKNVRGGYYRLVDEFTLFYKYWLQSFKKKALRLPKDYWFTQHNKPSFTIFSGYNFETLCQKHVDSILTALNIKGMAVDVATWLKRGTENEKGTQIDLLFDRADRIINLCEIKYTSEPVTIDKKLFDYYQNRQAIFKASTKTRKAVNSVLISFNGVRENQYLSQTFSKSLDYRALFL